jgi:hypothetical protein
LQARLATNACTAAAADRLHSWREHVRVLLSKVWPQVHLKVGESSVATSDGSICGLSIHWMLSESATNAVAPRPKQAGSAISAGRQRVKARAEARLRPRALREHAVAVLATVDDGEEHTKQGG